MFSQRVIKKKKKECRLVTKDSRIEEQKQFNFIKSSTMDNNKIAD